MVVCCRTQGAVRDKHGLLGRANRPKEEGRLKRLSGDTMRLLVTYMRPQWPRVALLALLLVGSIALQLFNPQILKGFIDSATGQGNDQPLFMGALLFLGVALVQQLASVGATYLSENV